MTLPSERTRAVLATEKFLLELCDPNLRYDDGIEGTSNSWQVEI